MAKYTYNPNEKDYEKLIQQAVAAGDMAGAAELEGYRNRKIQDMGLNYAPTYRYASNPEVNTAYERAKTEEYVPKQNEPEKYVPEKYVPQVTVGNPADFQYDAQKPAYQSPYSGQIDQLLNEILNREDFSYNYENDPMYKQFAETYTREGNRAMNDTLAATAANTGGLASSYSVGAANQANNLYMAQLSDKIPELEQLAYARYMDDYAMKGNDLGMLQGQDDRMYGRNRDSVGDWYTDKNFAYGQYMDQINRDMTVEQSDYNRFTDQRGWNYGVGRDAVADQRYADELAYNRFADQRDWNYGVGRDTIADQRYADELAYNRKWQEDEREHSQEQDAYAKAFERWSATGKVSKADAPILGVPAGTLTSDQSYRDAELELSSRAADLNASQESRIANAAKQDAAWNRWEATGSLTAADAAILGLSSQYVGMPYPGTEEEGINTIMPVADPKEIQTPKNESAVRIIRSMVDKGEKSDAVLDKIAEYVERGILTADEAERIVGSYGLLK